MNLYQKRNILMAMLIFWLLLCIAFGYIFSGDTVIILDALSFGACLLLHHRWWRCPYCLHSLGNLQLSVIVCPCCGKKIPKK